MCICCGGLSCRCCLLNPHPPTPSPSEGFWKAGKITAILSIFPDMSLYDTSPHRTHEAVPHGCAQHQYRQNRPDERPDRTGENGRELLREGGCVVGDVAVG